MTMSDLMYPRQSPTTHTEQLGEEASVYDWARAQVHALNPTAARVWRQCDGATSPAAIAAALRREMGTPEADAVVDLTLKQLARVHLLELPGESRGDRPATTRRWLLGRGVAAAMLPAIYSIVAPSPVEAQTPGAPAAPTLTSVSPNQGTPGTTVAGVTLTGTNFIVGATTVTVNSGGVTAANVVVGSTTSLTADIVIDPAAVLGAHTVTVTTAGGTSGPQTFTINVPSGSETFTFTPPAVTRLLLCPPASSASRLWPTARRAVTGLGLAAARVAWAVGRRRPCRSRLARRSPCASAESA
jgi:hypothetical protein